jgi:hypothetical protein
MNAASEPRERTPLRGPEVQSIGRRFWSVAGAVVLSLFALIIVVSFLSAANDNARIDRMKSHGATVNVTVTSCVGNIGGSGSNAAGYTCRGSYRVDGIRHQAVIGAKSTLSSVGTKLLAVADPEHPSTIELASAVATSSSSTTVYVVPTLLALLLIVLSILLIRRPRRAGRRRTPEQR